MYLLWILTVVIYLFISKYLQTSYFKSDFLSVIILSCYFILGGLSVQLQSIISTNHFTKWKSKENYLKIQLVEIPKKRSRYRSISEVQFIGTSPEKMNKSQGQILIYFPPNDNYKPKNGESFLIKGSLQKVIENTNPYAFSYKKYLYNRGVEHQIYLKPNAFIPLDNNEISSLKIFIESIKVKCLQIINQYIMTQENQGVAAAMILGHRNELSEELYDSYTDTGAVHCLAVSGLHVGIVATFLGFLLQFIPRHKSFFRGIKVIILILGVWFYAFLTGGAPAIIRASIMFSIMVCDFNWTERKNMFNSLGIAAILMLIHDPNVLFQAGFQFSFLALSGILIFYPKIFRLIPFIKNRPLRYLWGLVAVAVAAQITVFPVTIYYFHKFPSYFWLSGLVAIPLAFIILTTGISLLISHFIFPPLSTAIGNLLNIIISLLNTSIESIQKLPNSSNDDLWLDFYTIIVIYIAILLFGYLYYKYQRNVAVLFYTCLILLTIIFGIRNLSTRLQSKVMIYDIYEGSIVDFIDGRKIMSFARISRNDDSEKFMCDNYRMSINAEKVEKFKLKRKWKTERFIHENGLIMYNSTSILIITDSTKINNKIPIDYCIVSSQFSGSLSDLLQSCTPKSIIIDKSVPYFTTLKWKNQNTLNIPLKSLYETGALELNLN